MDYKDFNWTAEHFLLADDDHYAHILMDKMISNIGSTVIHAYDGVLAIELLRSDMNISVAIIDMLMPMANGFDVIREVREMRPDVIFVAYTADVIRVDKSKCLSSGFNLCVQKPVLPNKLFLSIMEALLVKVQDR